MIVVALGLIGCAVNQAVVPAEEAPVAAIEGAPAAAPEVEPLAANELIILHTNDLHGHFLPARANWIDGEPEIGGFVMIDSYVRELEATHGEDRVLLLDGGDILTGTPLTDMMVRGSMGGAMLEFMELTGYDAWVVGNHEFDKGFENINTLVASSAIPALSSNLLSPDGGAALEGQVPSVVIESGELTVAVIGATTESLGHLTSSETMAQIDLLEVAGAVQAEMARLDEESDLIVVLSHIGLDADKALAEAVDGIDLIVGGHSHTHLDEPEFVNNTWIVQAGSYGRSIGELRIAVEEDAIATFDGELVDLESEEVFEGGREEMIALASRYQEAIEAEYGQVVGEALGDFGRSYSSESALGRWITDTLRDATGAQVGVYNAGGIRADLVAGPLTGNDLFNVFPFSNQVVTFDVTGSDLIAIFIKNAAAEAFGDRGAVQISGVEVEWRMHGEVPELVSSKVAGEPIDPSALYRVATNSYMVDQAERYLAGAEPMNVEPMGKSVFEVAMEQVRQGAISPPENRRFIQVE